MHLLSTFLSCILLTQVKQQQQQQKNNPHFEKSYLKLSRAFYFSVHTNKNPLYKEERLASEKQGHLKETNSQAITKNVFVA